MQSGTRILGHSTVVMPEAPEGKITIDCEPLLVNYLSFGTGYGMEENWRHGMYQGPDLVVQGDDLPVSEVAGLGQYGVGGSSRQIHLQRTCGLRPLRARLLRAFPQSRLDRRSGGGALGSIAAADNRKYSDSLGR